MRPLPRSTTPTPSRRRGAALVGALLLLWVAGCSSLQSSLQSSTGVAGWLTPYKVEVVQGNVVTREQAAAVRPGMSRTQVREILGSPLLADPFHADRWDYVFTIRRPGADPQRRHVAVLFDGEALKSIEAPELPTEQEFIDSIAVYRKARVPELTLTEQQINALPVRPAAPLPAASAPPAPSRTYPPLEAQP